MGLPTVQWAGRLSLHRMNIRRSTSQLVQAGINGFLLSFLFMAAVSVLLVSILIVEVRSSDRGHDVQAKVYIKSKKRRRGTIKMTEHPLFASIQSQPKDEKRREKKKKKEKSQTPS